METDIKQLIGVRTQAINQFTADNVDPEDIIFYFIGSQFNMTLLPFVDDIAPSQKYYARKQVLTRLYNGTISPQLANATRFIYCSYDTVYDVDYCFDINCLNKDTTLYIVKNGNIVRRYKNYDMSYDERNDIAQL